MINFISLYAFLSAVLLLIPCSSVLSQASEIRALYHIESLKNPEDAKSGEAKSMITDANVLLNGFEFELLANKETAIFKKTKQLLRDDSNVYMYRLALAFCAGDEIWYTDISSNEKVISKDNSGEPVNLNLNEDLVWEITEESKSIGDFTASKAITQRKRGKTTYQVVAWFTADLPYPFGPLGFNGLPGLILELKRGNVIFLLNSLKEIDKKIKKPSASDSMSFEKYYELLDSQVATIKEKGY